LLRRRFFVEQFAGDRAVLRGEAANHLGRVLRAKVGQLYELSDGNSVRLGQIERAGRDEVEFALTETIPSVVPRFSATLLLSIVKFDRFEWAIEKATELGVARMFPLAAARSEKALVSAAAKRAERWRKILMESAQQARRLCVPELLPVARFSRESLKELGAVGGTSTPQIILSERADAKPLRDALAKYTREATTAATLAIGPEGGWTDEEFAVAQALGFVEASLGANILRTETAVAAALSSLNFLYD
jgi:16S rRNA (uracil1498-N3)-methyltransferase